jgi:hypothetical protein
MSEPGSSPTPDGAGASEPRVSVRLIVIRDDPRARSLLADVARRLALAELTPDAHGDVYIAVAASAAADAWERLRGALDAAGEDWWEYFHLPPHSAALRAGTARS